MGRVEDGPGPDEQDTRRERESENGGGFQAPMTSRGGRWQVEGGCRDWSGELEGSRPRSRSWNVGRGKGKKKRDGERDERKESVNGKWVVDGKLV
jgi:hypothetical protein